MSGVGGVVEVVDSNLTKDELFTASIGSVHLHLQNKYLNVLYPQNIYFDLSKVIIGSES